MKDKGCVNESMKMKDNGCINESTKMKDRTRGVLMGKQR